MNERKEVAISETDPDIENFPLLLSYSIETKIGRGQFSEVYKARCQKRQVNVALKKIKISKISDEKLKSDCVKEINILQVGFFSYVFVYRKF